MAHVGQAFEGQVVDRFLLRSGVLDDGLDLHFRPARSVPVDGGTGGADEIILQGVRTFRKGQGHGNPAVPDDDGVHDSEVDDIPVALGGMLNFLEPFKNLSFVH